MELVWIKVQLYLRSLIYPLIFTKFSKIEDLGKVIVYRVLGVLNREYICFGGRGILEMIKYWKVSNGTKIVCIPSKSLGN